MGVKPERRVVRNRADWLAIEGPATRNGVNGGGQSKQSAGGEGREVEPGDDPRRIVE
jgi:hypothetical protein